MHCDDAEFNGFLGVFAFFLQTFPRQPDIQKAVYISPIPFLFYKHGFHMYLMGFA